VTARRDPAGMVTLTASGYITIPAALRHHCGLQAGDQVLLAAIPGQDTLATG
jgi:AbrB family looped-hinge helix DNA binding protein